MAGRFPPKGKKTSLNLFGEVAKLCWPRKTAFELAAIANQSDRAAKEWLRGTVPPPGPVLAAIMVKLSEHARYHAKGSGES